MFSKPEEQLSGFFENCRVEEKIDVTYIPTKRSNGDTVVI